MQILHSMNPMKATLQARSLATVPVNPSLCSFHGVVSANASATMLQIKMWLRKGKALAASSVGDEGPHVYFCLVTSPSL